MIDEERDETTVPEPFDYLRHRNEELQRQLTTTVRFVLRAGLPPATVIGIVADAVGGGWAAPPVRVEPERVELIAHERMSTHRDGVEATRVAQMTGDDITND